MSFKITGPNGEPINSINDLMKRIEKEVVTTAENHIASGYNAFVEKQSSLVRCPVHQETVTSARTDYKDGQLNAQFEGCCDQLITLVRSEVKAAIDRGEFKV
jgi:hypothetical protein